MQVLKGGVPDVGFRLLTPHGESQVLSSLSIVGHSGFMLDCVLSSPTHFSVDFLSFPLRDTILPSLCAVM